ncbi:MAG TPA: hypothetical protein VIM56_05115 [Rhizomicrobium sp.]
MIPLSRIEDIERLYAVRGGLRYGEGVTQIEHALQSASLVEGGGGPLSLVVAALLHDIGHLFEAEADTLRADDRHEASAAKALATLFDEPVWKPIALHVAAKRYLCFSDPAYFASLSPASKISLELQGGVFDAAKAAAFEKLPYWREAVMLRRADDAGKRGEPCGLSFIDFVPLMRGIAKRV